MFLWEKNILQYAFEKKVFLIPILSHSSQNFRPILGN